MTNQRIPLRFRYAADRDTPAVMELWAKDFESYEPYYSWYFSCIYRPERTLLALTGDGRLAASLQIAPYTLSLPQGPQPAAYLVGVITEPSLRGRGAAMQLLQYSLEQLREQGYTAALLYTDIPRFYQPLGFRHAYALQRVSLPASLQETAAGWQKAAVNPETIGQCDAIYRRMTAPWQGYILRNAENWRTLLGELQCDQGSVWILPQQAYVWLYPENGGLIVREIGYTDSISLQSALALCGRLVYEGGFRHGRWLAPLTAPLPPGVQGQTVPFVMAKSLTGDPYLPPSAANWINEYT
ncbi:MAG: GNAT family N-acetyltransferase [Firmicutes bacterium]|nr:GNAT family N-acetyltransferase [Bacillota bacterium]